MEIRISDLLDSLTEVSVPIQPQLSASSNRIKELTMKKIHTEQKKTRRTMSGISKAILIAAIIAALAIPAAAAGGIQFTSWLEGLFDPVKSSYDEDQVIGSVSKNWEVSGWVVELSAVDANAEGLTLRCSHTSNAAMERSGSLNVDGSFWLEIWQDGRYQKLPEQSIPAGELVPVTPDTATQYPISWADSYGSLAPGSYRIGKNFTYIAEDGKQETVPFYAKFRVFDPDFGAVVRAHQDMLEALRTQDSYHLIVTNYQDDGDYDYYTAEIWKSGQDWLRELRYIQEDGSLLDRRGSLYKDGKGYTLEWSGDSVISPLSSYTSVDYLDDVNRDMWARRFEIHDISLGEVSGLENTTTFLMESNSLTGEIYYDVICMTAGEQGQLLETYSGVASTLEYTKESLRGLSTLTVFDTPADEAAAVVSAQNVTDPIAFSWAEDQAGYPNGETSGFVNTQAFPVSSAEEAIARAKAECTLEYQNKASAAYDEAGGMWRVELSCSQDYSVKQLVYLSEDGITQMVVRLSGLDP